MPGSPPHPSRARRRPGPIDVQGTVASGFERVADAFAANFEVRGDTAASCVVYAGGQVAIDLWAGTTPDGPWGPDCRSVVFSASKGVTTVCLLMAVEEGLIELDAPVTRYWPEYGAHGKEATTVRHVLAHRAGLMAPDVDLSAADLRAWDPIVGALAAQTPAWRPGTAYGYHALTFGWLAGEVLRRATGSRPGQWLAARIAEPLRVAMSYGADRAAPDVRALAAPMPDPDPIAAERQAQALAQPLVERSMSLGGVFDPYDMPASANRPEFLDAEMPGANLVASARGLARVYAATVGDVAGVRLLAPETVRDARAVQSRGTPHVGPDEGNQWGTGFMLHSRRRPMAGPGSFGHDGLGGQLAFGHLESQTAFAYQTIRPGGVTDDRAEALCGALRACI
ncbi:serine hydrolase [Nocardiopsis sp. NRRL B-16309]|uniref:serine hydrolase domain-containing protein n=1 Tax=Nocardiopsis sp. NRRL B-16309 TaxID=1519494 RepID=UPI0006ADF2FD|nr:serine hydrolase domain-containing protein [Nocardiopsis sp. NRRL B-16309]KOX12662.1 hypothetical protein ADL05_20445 [Nocardiopsis sp. NRRL B-16309]